MQRSAQEDELLIRRVAAGDRQALTDLVMRHGPALRRVARAVTGDDVAADDVTQDALLAAMRAAATYRPELGAVKPWLMAIARHRARRVRRTAAASRLTSLDDVPLLDLGLGAGWGCDGPDVAFERAEDVEQLARALASLEAPDREVLVLRDVEMLSGDETAKVLGIGLAAVKSRLHRARLRLLGALRSSEGSVVERERSVGGLRCSEVLAHLGEYVDGELGGDGRARIDAHLLECSVCERFGGRYARVVHGARVRLGADTTFDDRVADAIRHRLEQG